MGIPGDADPIIKYNTQNKSSWGVTIEDVAHHNVKGNNKWHAAVKLGRRIFGVPSNASSVISYDTALRTAKAAVMHLIAGEEHGDEL